MQSPPHFNALREESRKVYRVMQSLRVFAILVLCAAFGAVLLNPYLAVRVIGWLLIIIAATLAIGLAVYWAFKLAAWIWRTFFNLVSSIFRKIAGFTNSLARADIMAWLQVFMFILLIVGPTYVLRNYF